MKAEKILVTVGFLLVIIAAACADSEGFWWVYPIIVGIILEGAGAIIYSRRNGNE